MSDNGTGQSGGQTNGRWGWMRILLVASLAFNLVILGFAGGAFWKWRHGGHWGMRGFGGQISTYLRTLPDERRAEIRDAIRPLYTEIRPLRKNIRAARDDVAEVLKADRFDRAKFEEAMGKMRKEEFMARSALTSVLAEFAGKMTAAERRNYVKHLQRRHRWRRSRHRAPFDRGRDRGVFPEKKTEQ